ncbi:RDD family protein [Nocardia huaxiensis]|uniref:RDD family protein n=1 Tax=Nocardia huaxiensis TaxID=2755382 RepID=UPI001E63F16E|nr:RDD family protein [Nocardia huaxiensis]UFS95473.1 RDD family protein [Nocardia huaxiensis]
MARLNTTTTYRPPKLRRLLAFCVDWALHLGVAAAVILSDLSNLTLVPLALLVVWPTVSFLHRTVFQWLFHATIGKLLFGLVIIRPEDGGWVGFPMLVRLWFRGIYLTGLYVISSLLSGGESDDWDDKFPPVVRRCDVNNLASNGFRTNWAAPSE